MCFLNLALRVASHCGTMSGSASAFPATTYVSPRITAIGQTLRQHIGPGTRRILPRSGGPDLETKLFHSFNSIRVRRANND